MACLRLLLTFMYMESCVFVREDFPKENQKLASKATNIGLGKTSDFLYTVLCLVFYPTLTLNKYPTKAVSPIATVPQNVMRIIAFPIPEPPAFAAIAPKIIRKKRAKP
jgi:hypothetical protein